MRTTGLTPCRSPNHGPRHYFERVEADRPIEGEASLFVHVDHSGDEDIGIAVTPDDSL